MASMFINKGIVVSINQQVHNAIQHEILFITIILLLFKVQIACCAFDKLDYDISNEINDSAVYANEIPDPLESINRRIFAFNNIVDTNITQHLLRPYKNIQQYSWLQERAISFIHNLNEPVYMLNSILQWDLRHFFRSMYRFIVNSIFGFFGFVDVAGKYNIRSKALTFNTTLAKWKGTTGPYLILPLLGPITTREAAGLSVDLIFNPLNMVLPLQHLYSTLFIKFITAKSAYIDVTDHVKIMALDEYSMIRSLYAQKIQTGMPHKN